MRQMMPNPSKKRREKPSIEEITKCPQCGGTHLTKDYSRAELVCEDCGLVIDEDFIDHGPEWRAFDSDQREKRARVGAPMTYTIHDKQGRERRQPQPSFSDAYYNQHPCTDHTAARRTIRRNDHSHIGSVGQSRQFCDTAGRYQHALN